MSAIDELWCKDGWDIMNFVTDESRRWAAHGTEGCEEGADEARRILSLYTREALLSANSHATFAAAAQPTPFYRNALRVPVETLTARMDTGTAARRSAVTVARDVRLVCVAAEAVTGAYLKHQAERFDEPWDPPALAVDYDTALHHIAALIESTGHSAPEVRPAHASALGFHNYCTKCLNVLGHSGTEAPVHVIVSDDGPAIVDRGERRSLADVYEARAAKFLLERGSDGATAVETVNFAGVPDDARATGRERDWMKRGRSETFSAYIKGKRGHGGGFYFAHPNGLPS